MNYLRDCRTCGGPVYGTWLYSYHTCKPTPYTVTFQAPAILALPAPKATEPTAEHDRITPGEAARLCSRIKMQMAIHFKSCTWCQILKEQDLMCVDGIWLQDALDHWEQHALIEVDRK